MVDVAGQVVQRQDNGGTIFMSDTDPFAAPEEVKTEAPKAVVADTPDEAPVVSTAPDFLKESSNG
jgi:hypothetical protein